MRGTVFSRLWLGVRRLLRDRRGNAMFLTAAAILPIIGLLGSGIDIGRAYMAQLRLQQACDAGVLAGRRAMAGSTYTSAAQAEANKMFNFNYTSAAYGSSGVTFSSRADGPSNVKGSATAKLPTALMQIFNFREFNLAVNCTAKLEISNADVMLVLDVTGSMAQTNSGDSVNRITALKSATMDFFDTLTTAEVGDGRLRFGVVPYSSTANVGAILYAKNPAWLANNVMLPSRTPVVKVTWGNATTVPDDDYTDGQTVKTGEGWTGVVADGESSSSCSARDPLPASAPSPSGSPDYNRTAQYVDSNGNRITTYDVEETYVYVTHAWAWRERRRGDRCEDYSQNWRFTRTSQTTVTETPTKTFDNKYVYQDRVFDVSQAKAGTAISTDTGDAGVSVSHTWGGCVMERATTPFASNQAAPAAALDMDVDTAPTSDDDTKWKLLIPEIAFPRASSPSTTPSSTGAVNVNSSSVSGESGTNGNWQNFSRYWGSGWGVCPVAAMKLTKQTASDRGTFNTYIQSLQPVGGTYHDAGMVWGVRLLSPDGMFGDENADSAAPNKRPVSRHIVFMTDGEMAPNMGNLSFQGYEWISKRIGATSDSELTARHNNRFLQLCEKAKAKNITIWVVGFGVALNTQLTSCATAGKAYQANNATQLNDNFQAIARQISKLRLSE